MPVLSRLVSVILRVGELVFASVSLYRLTTKRILTELQVVAGIVGCYLHDFDQRDGWPKKRFIYSEVIAGVSILFSLLWLLPFAGGFYSWPLDLVLSAAWFAAFGLLVDQLSGQNCGRTFNWSGITHAGFCNRWKAAQAFSFLSAIFWLVSAIVGIWFMSKNRRERAAAAQDVKYVWRTPRNDEFLAS